MRSHRRSIHNHISPSPDAWQRDIRLLAASRGVSMAGAEAGHIAQLALAWHLTGSAGQASLVLLAYVVSRTVGAPVAGWIGDHLDRRVVIIASELAVAVTLCAMATAQTMTQLLLVCMLHGLAAMTCGAALDAAVAGLVPANQLSKANSTLGMARTAGHMLGPVFGGLLVAGVGARSAFLLDAASSVIAAALVLGIRGDVGGAASEQHRSSDTHDRSMLAGLRVLAADPLLRLLMAGWAMLCVCFAFVTAAELPLAAAFGLDETGLGMIVSSWCAGALLGSWTARRVRVEDRGARVLALNAIACAGVFGAVAVVPSFWCVLALMAIGGFSMSLAEVVETTLIQTRVEDAVRARALAGYQGLMSAVWGTNLALAGLFVDAFSPQAAYAYGAAWCLVGAVAFAVLVRAQRSQLLAATLRVLRPRHALESELAEGA
jgi:MFS family permease